MMRSSFILSLCLTFGLSRATTYTLQDDYSGSSFFSMFDFFTDTDPTEGYTNYVSYDDALSLGLIQDSSNPSWGVDSVTVLDPSDTTGRSSIRMTSKNTYNHGLFVLDLAHMPDSVCGVWPAFWTFGQSGTWPLSGEIDIIEFVNKHTTDLMTLHTAPGCSINGDSTLMTGDLVSGDCAVVDGSGCGINNTDSTSAGTGFDNAGGGVYAMEWTSDFIRIWFWSGDSAPSTILSDTPDTSDLGTPVALFEGSCDIDTYFYDHAIIFDTTFCGDWAGATYISDGCAADSNGDASLGSCVTYVAENPSAYTGTYWAVNSLKVYQADSTVSARTTNTTHHKEGPTGSHNARRGRTERY